MVPNLRGGCPVSKTVQHFLSKNVAFIILNFYYFEFLCPTGESVCVVVDACMTDFKCCDLQYSD